jgi:hypothetical protein
MAQQSSFGESQLTTTPRMISSIRNSLFQSAQFIARRPIFVENVDEKGMNPLSAFVATSPEINRSSFGCSAQAHSSEVDVSRWENATSRDLSEF